MRMSPASTHDAIAAFLNSMIEPGSDLLWSPDQLRWKLDASPGGRGVLTCATVDGNVVSTLTISRRRIWWRGRQVNAGELGDGFTHPYFRGPWSGRPSPIIHLLSPNGYRARRTTLAPEISLFSILAGCCHRAAARLGIELIYGTPNDCSGPGLMKWSGYLRHPMMLNSMERPPSTDIRPVSAGAVREVNWYSPALDDLWCRLRDQRELGPVRDRVYFKYRFAANPVAQYDIWGLWRAGTLAGISVTRRHEIVPGRRDICLADWLYDTARPDDLRRLLAHALVSAGPGYHATAWVGEDRPDALILKSLGFTTGRQIPIIVHQSGLGPAVRRCASFDFTIATSDNI